MHKKTYVAPETSTTRWHLIDAKGLTLGRLAVQIANLLRGKTRADFTPHITPRDHVVVVNTAEVAVSGGKEDTKLYRDYSGYRGGLREEQLRDVREANPTRPLRDAVKSMLPKNRLQAVMMKNLHTFAGAEHDHVAQKPTALDLSSKAA